MWYKYAQKTQMSYSIKSNYNNSIISLYSPLAKNGLPAYPKVNVILRFDNIHQSDRILDLVESDIKSNHVEKIMEAVLNVLVKYPPGVLTDLINKSEINVISQVKIPFNKVDPAGAYRPHTNRIYLEYDKITHVLEHEIGHAVDFNKYFPALIPGAKSSTDYGSTNNEEAFAEAYRILTENGINFRYPNTDEKNISYNLLLDHVANVIKKQKLPGFVDFGYDIKFRPQFRNIDTQSYSDTEYLKGARITSLVGAFQSAINRHEGNKNDYIKKLQTDKQLKNDIVAFINKTQLPFVLKPAAPEEINIALQYITTSSNKKIDESGSIIDPKTGYEVYRKDSVKENTENELIGSRHNYLPKSIKEFLDKNPQLQKKKNIEPKDFINKINTVFINDSRVPALNFDQYYAGEKIIEYYKSKKLIGNYELEEFYFKETLDNLLSKIFPNLKFNNPEDYLFFDFHQNENGSFVLEIDAVRQKVMQAVNSHSYFKKLNDLKKNKIVNDLVSAIQSYALTTIKFINQYKQGNVGKYIAEQFNTLFARKDNFSLAKKAVDKLIVSRLPRKNFYFMRIYNNSNLNDIQKKSILEYYRSKFQK